MTIKLTWEPYDSTEHSKHENRGNYAHTRQDKTGRWMTGYKLVRERYTQTYGTKGHKEWSKSSQKLFKYLWQGFICKRGINASKIKLNTSRWFEIQRLNRQFWAEFKETVKLEHIYSKQAWVASEKSNRSTSQKVDYVSNDKKVTWNIIDFS